MKDKKLKLFFDFDGVIVNTIECIVGLYNSDFKYYKDFKYIDHSIIKTYDFIECNCATKKCIDTYFNTERFFNNLKFMPFAKEMLDLLYNCGFEINIVSHGFSPNLVGKKIWIEKNIPYAHFIGINLKENTDKACVDMSNGFFTDDKTSNLNSSNAKYKVIYGNEYPWNNDSDYIRCCTWIELIAYILKCQL